MSNQGNDSLERAREGLLLPFLRGSHALGDI